VLGHYDRNGKVAGSITDEVTGFFNLPSPSSRTVAPGSIQPLNRNEYQESSWVKEWAARNAENLNSDLRAECLENVRASTVYYKDSFASQFI
jgi:hypothetical protein